MESGRRGIPDGYRNDGAAPMFSWEVSLSGARASARFTVGVCRVASSLSTRPAPSNG